MEEKEKKTVEPEEIKSNEAEEEKTEGNQEEKLLSESLEEIERIKAEAEAARDRLLRAAAEYENFKKRAEREKEEAMKFIAESIVLDIIPIVDNLDRAIKSAQSDEKKNFDALLQGIEMIQKQMLSVLEKYGVGVIESEGQPFDPRIHEAILQVPSEEYPENTVVQEFERGYTLHDKVIRPAKVIVSKLPEPKEKEEGENVDA
ncbi:TPA: nucleotide exchange factor GrpE [Candidatus Poribacteria bacterium]|nr:nucleotide exchange factor GrpE [Candidatus Poribacteria bacterium]